MVDSEFFDTQTKASKVKSLIVSDYFYGWANVMVNRSISHRLCYYDFFCGPGYYEDGSPSTPVLVLEQALKLPKLLDKLRIIFNDANPDFYRKIKECIKGFDEIDQFKIKPDVFNLEVSDETTRVFEHVNQVPSLSFLDPWGYKGLSLELVKVLAQSWGCDCIFFFNYRRVNPAIGNYALEEPIVSLLSEDLVVELRQCLQNKSPREREEIIVNKIKDQFKSWGFNYFIAFPFKNETGKRTTHYLIFICKHRRGFEIMKNVMGKHSSSEYHGFPSFEYSPRKKLIGLFDNPEGILRNSLLKDLPGKTLSFEQIYDQHADDKLYLEKNYRKVLLDLEAKRLIKTNRDTRKPKTRNGTFPKDLLAQFP